MPYVEVTCLHLSLCDLVSMTEPFGGVFWDGEQAWVVFISFFIDISWCTTGRWIIGVMPVQQKHVIFYISTPFILLLQVISQYRWIFHDFWSSGRSTGTSWWPDQRIRGTQSDQAAVTSSVRYQQLGQCCYWHFHTWWFVTHCWTPQSTACRTRWVLRHVNNRTAQLW